MHLPERNVIAVVETREVTSYCRCCGVELIQTAGHKQKEFFLLHVIRSGGETMF